MNLFPLSPIVLRARRLVSVAYSRIGRLIRGALKRWPIRRELLGTHGFLMPIQQGSIDLSSLAKPCSDANLIVEVGANTGQDTARMLEVFQSARLLCFEPDARAAKGWRETISNSRATLFELAISDSVGTVVFYESSGIPPQFTAQDFPDGWHLSGSILPPKEHTQIHPWSTFNHQVEVASRTLDDVLKAELERERSEFPIGLIWADVQGAEEKLLRGGSETLTKTRYLYTEFGTTELYEGQILLRNLIKMLPGFRVKQVWTNDVLFENRAFSRHAKSRDLK